MLLQYKLILLTRPQVGFGWSTMIGISRSSLHVGLPRIHGSIFYSLMRSRLKFQLINLNKYDEGWFYSEPSLNTINRVLHQCNSRASLSTLIPLVICIKIQDKKILILYIYNHIFKIPNYNKELLNNESLIHLLRFTTLINLSLNSNSNSEDLGFKNYFIVLNLNY